ncbi:YheC/YheD family protein [Polycladomyces subterraneus]|uniref:YheC/YheD family protein n=1 Tax=Polycladomyces subterraneus TaxID=1016997 RepID=A0ABT8IJK7_9BACL|nr:YheC/YheD family protein [Polycladomyces subterraneus]MDN4592970.1 YheC/YheD family protein [Polycladomyces subterraneus]
MALANAGWFAWQNATTPVAFIPHPRYSPKPLPEQLSVILGIRWKAKIPVVQKRTSSSNTRYTPAWILPTSDDDEYRAGPFVAILTSDGNRDFRGNKRNFIDIIRMGRKLGVTVFVVTPRGINPYTSSVRGYLLDDHGEKIRWIPATMPMPNIVYNRIPNRLSEKRHEEQDAIQFFLDTPGIQLFNPSFFDKWTLYEYLMNSDETQPFLPETVQWNNGTECRQLFQRHPILFLKPVDGKAGLDMIRIIRKPNGYEVIHQTRNGKKRYHTTQLKSLWQFLETLTYHRKYILQQGIPLATYRNRPFDLRLLLQKDGTGCWQVTGLGIRVAGQDAISTHVPMGGSIAPAPEVLRDVFRNRQSEIQEAIEQTALKIARHIETEKQCNLGEMSMDLGIEQDGRLWFFEANAKPMKFDEPDIRHLSLARLIHYCLYLSGFKQSKEA